MAEEELDEDYDVPLYTLGQQVYDPWTRTSPVLRDYLTRQKEVEEGVVISPSYLQRQREMREKLQETMSPTQKFFEQPTKQQDEEWLKQLRATPSANDILQKQSSKKALKIIPPKEFLPEQEARCIGPAVRQQSTSRRRTKIPGRNPTLWSKVLTGVASSLNQPTVEETYRHLMDLQKQSEESAANAKWREDFLRPDFSQKPDDPLKWGQSAIKPDDPLAWIKSTLKPDDPLKWGQSAIKPDDPLAWMKSTLKPDDPLKWGQSAIKPVDHFSQSLLQTTDNRAELKMMQNMDIQARMDNDRRTLDTMPIETVRAQTVSYASPSRAYHQPRSSAAAYKSLHGRRF